ncbi:MAG: caspase family protein [Alphaproteobacteria bacterium]|nr:caspase family protein [Alphaproteobacteria bacterium]
MRTLRTFTAAGLLWASTGAVAHAQDATVPANLYAVVIGVGTYPTLPAEANLASAHGEASRVALALKEEAGFTDVRLLTDSAATREGLRKVIQDDLAQRVGYDDLLMVYFVGQGLGADFEDPYLLLYDSDQANLPASALGVGELAGWLQSSVQAGSYAIVTDAAHAGSLNGIALLGPAATSWPALPGSTFYLSANAAARPGVEGAFGKHFIDGITGGADFSDDGHVTTSELHRYLLLAVPDETGNSQYPADAGTNAGNLAVSKGVLFKSTLPAHLDPTKEPVVVDSGAGLSAFEVDKVKFVFRDAFEPVVQCRDQQPKACENQCYLWNVTAGICEVTAYVGGTRVTGKALVAARGAYVCEPKAGDLVCKAPQ